MQSIRKNIAKELADHARSLENQINERRERLKRTEDSQRFLIFSSSPWIAPSSSAGGRGVFLRPLPL